jgi:hypothetical protein
MANGFRRPGRRREGTYFPMDNRMVAAGVATQTITFSELRL